MLKINNRDISAVTVGISRSVRCEEKYRVTCEDGVTHSEVRSQYLDFALEIGGLDRPEYDSLFAELLKGGEVTVDIDGEEFIGLFNSVSDAVYYEDEGGAYHWDELKLNFLGTRPLEV